MIDIHLRCITRARWLALAENRGLIDVDGNPVDGVGIDEIGSVVITPAVVDSEGNVTTPAVIDTWHWVNLRLYSDKFRDDEDEPEADDAADETTHQFKFFKSKLVKFIRNQATRMTVRGVRVYQFGSGSTRIQIIDPRDYVPVRIWAGGMNP